MLIVARTDPKTAKDTVVDVLIDGDSIEMDPAFNYSFILYVPDGLTFSEFSQIEGDVFGMTVDALDEETNENVILFIAATVSNDSALDNQAATFSFTFDDGSTESITIYLTRQ